MKLHQKEFESFALPNMMKNFLSVPSFVENFSIVEFVQCVNRQAISNTVDIVIFCGVNELEISFWIFNLFFFHVSHFTGNYICKKLCIFLISPKMTFLVQHMPNIICVFILHIKHLNVLGHLHLQLYRLWDSGLFLITRD